MSSPVAGRTAEQPQEGARPRRPAFPWQEGLCGLVGGAIVGLFGTLQHMNSLQLGGIALPLGLAAALLSVVALMLGCRLVTEGRVATIGAAIGMVVVILLASLKGPGGAVLIPDSDTSPVLSPIWVYAAPLLAVIAVLWPVPAGHARTRAGAGIANEANRLEP